MIVTAPNCLSCKVEMEEGFIPDLGHANAASQPKWTEGAPEKSFWTGLKLKDRERLPIATYRCPQCGLLQSYARRT
jgi:hypothetical protein